MVEQVINIPHDTLSDEDVPTAPVYGETDTNGKDAPAEPMDWLLQEEDRQANPSGIVADEATFWPVADEDKKPEEDEEDRTSNIFHATDDKPRTSERTTAEATSEPTPVTTDPAIGGEGEDDTDDKDPNADEPHYLIGSDGKPVLDKFGNPIIEKPENTLMLTDKPNEPEENENEPPFTPEKYEEMKGTYWHFDQENLKNIEKNEPEVFVQAEDGEHQTFARVYTEKGIDEKPGERINVYFQNQSKENNYIFSSGGIYIDGEYRPRNVEVHIDEFTFDKALAIIGKEIKEHDTRFFNLDVDDDKKLMTYLEAIYALKGKGYEIDLSRTTKAKYADFLEANAAHLEDILNANKALAAAQTSSHTIEEPTPIIEPTPVVKPTPVNYEVDVEQLRNANDYFNYMQFEDSKKNAIPDMEHLGDFSKALRDAEALGNVDTEQLKNANDYFNYMQFEDSKKNATPDMEHLGDFSKALRDVEALGNVDAEQLQTATNFFNYQQAEEAEAAKKVWIQRFAQLNIEGTPEERQQTDAEYRQIISGMSIEEKQAFHKEVWNAVDNARSAHFKDIAEKAEAERKAQEEEAKRQRLAEAVENIDIEQLNIAKDFVDYNRDDARNTWLNETAHVFLDGTPEEKAKATAEYNKLTSDMPIEQKQEFHNKLWNTVDNIHATRLEAERKAQEEEAKKQSLAEAVKNIDVKQLKSTKGFADYNELENVDDKQLQTAKSFFNYQQKEAYKEVAAAIDKDSFLSQILSQGDTKGAMKIKMGISGVFAKYEEYHLASAHRKRDVLAAVDTIINQTMSKERDKQNATLDQLREIASNSRTGNKELRDAKKVFRDYDKELQKILKTGKTR